MVSRKYLVVLLRKNGLSKRIEFVATQYILVKTRIDLKILQNTWSNIKNAWVFRRKQETMGTKSIDGLSNILCI